MEEIRNKKLRQDRHGVVELWNEILEEWSFGIVEWWRNDGRWSRGGGMVE